MFSAAWTRELVDRRRVGHRVIKRNFVVRFDVSHGEQTDLSAHSTIRVATIRSSNQCILTTTKRKQKHATHLWLNKSQSSSVPTVTMNYFETVKSDRTLKTNKRKRTKSSSICMTDWVNRSRLTVFKSSRCIIFLNSMNKNQQESLKNERTQKQTHLTHPPHIATNSSFAIVSSANTP